MKVPHRNRMPAEKTALARKFRLNPSPPEAILWQHLRNKQLGVRVKRQEPMFGWIADFWCPSYNLVIEVDGKFHERQKEADALRDRVLLGHGVATIRFTAREVFRDAKDVAGRIQAAMRTRGRRG